MKAKNYRRVKGQPYVRRKFIKGHPPPKIVKFTMGNSKAKFERQLTLIAQRQAQIRHNALEAARIATNRHLQQNAGVENYFLRIVPYPHNVLRENKMIFGAHADRLQDGMKRSFGKPIGTAARVDSKQPIIVVQTNSNYLDVAKEALRLGKAKLPVPCRII